MAIARTFHFRVLVGMHRIPLHARNAATAHTILGPAGAEVDVVRPADVPVDDDRELFVTAWCLHPRFIPGEQVIFIPKPRLMSAAEASVSVLRGLRYLIRLRLIAFQDWSSPPGPRGDGGGENGDNGGNEGDGPHHGGGPLTPEDDYSGRRDSDDDDESADSNCNRYHPGIDRLRRACSPPSVQIGMISCPLAGPTLVTRGSSVIGELRGISDVASPRHRTLARHKIRSDSGQECGTRVQWSPCALTVVGPHALTSDDSDSVPGGRPAPQSPSPMLIRSSAHRSPRTGLVGRFLAIAPHLLHGGRTVGASRRLLHRPTWTGGRNVLKSSTPALLLWETACPPPRVA